MSQAKNPLPGAAQAHFSPAASAALPAGARRTAHQRRTTIVMWLRNMHGWIGLWGALLGLIFGTAGIWLNHPCMLRSHITIVVRR